MKSKYAWKNLWKAQNSIKADRRICDMDRRVITDEQLDVLLRNTLQEKADCIEVSNRLKKKN